MMGVAALFGGGREPVLASDQSLERRGMINRTTIRNDQKGVRFHGHFSALWLEPASSLLQWQ